MSRLLITFSLIMYDYTMSLPLLSNWPVFWTEWVKGIVLRLFASNRSSRRGNLVRACVRDILLKRVLREFLKQASREAGRQASREAKRQASKPLSLSKSLREHVRERERGEREEH